MQNGRRSIIVWAAGASLCVLGLYVGLMFDFFGKYHPYSDDAGVILHSCTPWFSAGRWSDWFTQGWARYAVNYPNWGPFGNNTLKPVVNLVFCLEGLFTPQFGNSTFLIMSYLAPAITVFALVFVFNRLGRATAALSFVLALCVGFSALWIGSLVNAVDMTNTLALMFSAIVLALLPTYDLRPPPFLQVGLVMFQLMAVFSHETALVLSPVCVVLVFALSSSRPRIRYLWPFAAAPILWVGVRLFVLQAHSGVYALSASGLAHAKVWGYWFLSVLVPIDVQGLWMARGLASMSHASLRIPIIVAVATLLAVNLIFICVVVLTILRRRDKRSLLLGLAFVLASAPHLTTAFDLYGARFAGLSMTVGILVCLLLFPNWTRVLMAVACILLVAEVLYSFTGLIERKTVAAAACVAATQYSAYVHEAVNQTKPNRVVVVNDRFGQFGVPAMVRLNAWPHQDFDVVVIDNLSLGDYPAGNLTIQRLATNISIACTVGGDSTMSFLGADRADFDIENQGFKYDLRAGTVESPGAIVAVAPLSDKKTLILGYRPDGTLIRPVLF